MNCSPTRSMGSPCVCIVYLKHIHPSQSYHFDRDDVALPGFAKYFREVAKCELEEAERFMKFQNDRGGRVKLHNIRKPKEDEWGDGG